MIRKPNGYDQAASYDGSRETLPPGGYICKILGAGEEIVAARGQNLRKFVLRIDIDGGPYNGWFARQHRRDQQRAAQSGGQTRWRGVYETFMETQDGACNPYFKGLLGCIEQSNPGFTWQWDERALVGLQVGLVFREERYIGQDGKAHTAVRACSARTVAAIKEGIEPPPVKDRTGSAGTSGGHSGGYRAPAPASAPAQNGGFSYAGDPGPQTVVDDDELPF